MRHPLPAVLLLAACASPWIEAPKDLPTEVGDRSVYHATSCLVVASDSSTAKEAKAFYDALATAAATATGERAPRALLLAIAFDDPLPVAPVERYVDHLLPLHERVTGIPRHVQAADAPRTKDGEPIEVDPTWGPRMLAFAAPTDDTSLGLPESLRRQADFVVVLPTRSCIEEVADAMLDAGLEANGASFFERTAIAPFRGTILAELADTVETQMRTDLLAAVMRKDSCTDEQLAAACATLALSPARVRGTVANEVSEAEVAELHLALSRLRTAKHDARLSVGAAATPRLAESYCTMGYTHFVEVGSAGNETFAAAATAAGKHYVHLPWSGDLPDRALAEAFAKALPADANARVLVVGATDETGPMLVAAHAFYVAGVERNAAIEAAQDLGVVGALGAFAKSLPREPADAARAK